jgi:hypothetical protein
MPVLTMLRRVFAGNQDAIRADLVDFEQDFEQVVKELQGLEPKVKRDRLAAEPINEVFEILGSETRVQVGEAIAPTLEELLRIMAERIVKLEGGKK